VSYSFPRLLCARWEASYQHGACRVRAISSVKNYLLGERKRRHPLGKYSEVKLDDTAISRGEYKRYLGGGAEHWDARGAFQLELMVSLGLKPHSPFLDIGCGPLRAGVHFIRFLECKNYAGIDSNESFIRAAELSVDSDEQLRRKQPRLELVQDFDFLQYDLVGFDFALAFSVLNHAGHLQRELFLSNLGSALNPGGKAVVTHAKWLKPHHLAGKGLRKTQKLNSEDLEFEIQRYGWRRDEIFPVYVIERKSEFDAFSRYFQFLSK